MIYLVLFCYCFRVIPILIMKNSFKVNTIIYVYWYIYIHVHRKDKLFTSICPYTLNFPLDSIFCKILHLISNTKKKNHCKQLYWIKTKWVFLCAQIA